LKSNKFKPKLYLKFWFWIPCVGISHKYIHSLTLHTVRVNCSLLMLEKYSPTIAKFWAGHSWIVISYVCNWKLLETCTLSTPCYHVAIHFHKNLKALTIFFKHDNLIFWLTWLKVSSHFPEVTISLFIDEIVTITFSQTPKLTIQRSSCVVRHCITVSLNYKDWSKKLERCVEK